MNVFKIVIMRFILVFVLCLTNRFLFSQDVCKHHCTEIMIDKMTLTTCLSIKEKDAKIQMTSPKNADVRLIGRSKSTLGRLAKKSPKKGILLNMEGTRSGEEISGIVKVAFLGNFKFKGTFNDFLDIHLLSEDGTSFGHIQSISKDGCPTTSYQELHNKLIQTTEEKIFSKAVLNDKSYITAQKKLKNIFNDAKDDIELFFGFQIYSGAIPFSHYNLLQIPNIDYQGSESSEKEVNTEFKELSDNTAYVKIDNFESTEEEIKDIFEKIHSKSTLQNLIIDLRDNPGGGIEAGYEFGKNVMKGKTDIGYFITNKYNKDAFDIDVFSQFSQSVATTTEGFLDELIAKGGLKMTFENKYYKVFEGQIYVLTSNVTASTSEPIAYALHKKRNAILIGQTTAGKMLSAKMYNLQGKYQLLLPIGDFYTYDGVRLEGRGVQPTHECDPKEALDVALKLIELNN